MGKRSNFKRNPRDFYETPIDAKTGPFRFLVPHLHSGATYISPCYGNGNVEKGLSNLCDAKCVGRSELYPDEYDRQEHIVWRIDARTGDYSTVDADFFIDNPPWMRKEKKDTPEKNGKFKFKPSNQQPLHMVIDNLASQKPTWLLFDSDWAYTAQAAQYLKYCVMIVAVGRVSWMGNGNSGMDNASWYLFDKSHIGETIFVGRGDNA